MAMTVFREEDVDTASLKGITIAILGYGNQGHAHALNLRDSGYDVIVGARDGSPSGIKAKEAGFSVFSYADSCARADLVMMTLPDEHIPAVYENDVAPNLKSGGTLGFAHGFAVHFGYVRPRNDLDVFLVGPKGAGRWLRAEFVAGRGLACLVAVAQDASGTAKKTALAYGAALGCGRAGMLETSFAEECETDLFGEQAVLCGGIPALIEAGYDTLVEAGYSPELAYFECLHEAKLILDLLYEAGPAGMREAISNTAEFGGYLAGEKLIGDNIRRLMQEILNNIRDGSFARRLMTDVANGSSEMTQMRRKQKSDIETVGKRIREIAFVKNPS